MTNLPSTVVAIPVYNAAKFLERSLESCLRQTVVPEVWVVDNCSTDNTCVIAEAFSKLHPNIKIIRNTKNLGRIGNWNRCLELFEESSFEFVKFLFMGDVLLPDCIEKIEAVRLQNPGLAAISWPYIFRDLDGVDKLSPMESTVNRVFSKENLLAEGFFPGDFLGAIVSNAFSRLGIYNNRFDDYLIGIVSFYDRLVTKGPVYFIAHPLSRFNLDSHKTFHRALNWDMALESAFVKARSLENNHHWIDLEQRKIIKERILNRMLRDLLMQFSHKTWMKQLTLILLLSTKARIFVLIGIIKRKCTPIKFIKRISHVWSR